MSTDAPPQTPADIDAEVMDLLNAGGADPAADEEPQEPDPTPEPADEGEPETPVAEENPEAAPEAAEVPEAAEASEEEPAAQEPAPNPLGITTILDQHYGTDYATGATSDAEALTKLTDHAKLGQQVAAHSQEFSDFLAAKAAAEKPAAEPADDGMPELPDLDPRFQDLARMGDNADPAVVKLAEKYASAKLVREDHLMRSTPQEMKDLRADIVALKEMVQDQRQQTVAKTQAEQDQSDYDKFLGDNSSALYTDGKKESGFSAFGKQFQEALYSPDIVDPATQKLRPGVTPTVAMQSAMFRVMQAQPTPEPIKAPVEPPASAMRQGPVAKLDDTGINTFDERLAKMGDNGQPGDLAKLLEELDKSRTPE